MRCRAYAYFSAWRADAMARPTFSRYDVSTRAPSARSGVEIGHYVTGGFQENISPYHTCGSLLPLIAPCAAGTAPRRRLRAARQYLAGKYAYRRLLMLMPYFRHAVNKTTIRCVTDAAPPTPCRAAITSVATSYVLGRQSDRAPRADRTMIQYQQRRLAALR